MQTNRHKNVKFASANNHKNVVFDNSIIDDALVVYNTNIETLLDTEFYGRENTFFTDDITADYRCMNYFIWKNVLYNVSMKTITDLINERLAQSIEITKDIKEKIEKIEGVEYCSIMPTSYKILIGYNDNLNMRELMTFMNFLGYAKDKNSNENECTFEAYHPKEIDYTYKYAYHITTKEKYEKSIINKGLIPKQKPEHNKIWIEDDKRNLEYPGRVYLFSENTSKKDILSFFRLKARICNIDDKPILLKIDIENMRKTGRDVSLFADPAFNICNAMFTMEPIPFKYISIEEL